MYEWRASDVGYRADERIQEEIRKRQAYIWNIDLPEMVADARAALGRHLSEASA